MTVVTNRNEPEWLGPEYYLIVHFMITSIKIQLSSLEMHAMVLYVFFRIIL